MKLGTEKEGQAEHLLTDHQVGLRAGFQVEGTWDSSRGRCSETGLRTGAEKMEWHPWGRAKASYKDATLDTDLGAWRATIQELPRGAERVARRPHPLMSLAETLARGGVNRWEGKPAPSPREGKCFRFLTVFFHRMLEPWQM